MRGYTDLHQMVYKESLAHKSTQNRNIVGVGKMYLL